MATQSFYEIMEIDTPEKAENLRRAFRRAEERGPLKFSKEVQETVRELMMYGEATIRSSPLDRDIETE